MSLHSSVTTVEVNGKNTPFTVDENASDQHVHLRTNIASDTTTIHIQLKHDFGLSILPALPSLGARSGGLRVISESWNQGHSQVTLEVAGAPGQSYLMPVWNPSEISMVSGAKVIDTASGSSALAIAFPRAQNDDYSTQRIVIDLKK